MESSRISSIPKLVKIGLWGLFLGLLLTWLSNLFLFSDLRIRGAAYPIYGRDFKTVAYEIGTLRMSVTEVVLLSVGALFVASSFVIFLYKADSLVLRKNIAGFATGVSLLLVSIPVLQLWEPITDLSVHPPSGPIAISLILSIGGAIIVIVYIFKTGMFLRNSVIPPRTRAVMYIIMSVGVIAGCFFLLIGTAGFHHYGTFAVGRGMLILSPSLFLLALVIGAIAYAKDREQVLEMETIREVRKNMKLRKLEEQRYMNDTPSLV